jgi:DnaJ-class molecular chaperone
MQDPYKTLGVSRTASQEDIKKSYRRLVKEYHPDVNPGDTLVEQRFKEVSAAYDLIGDKDKRARFDRGEIDADGNERPDAAFRRAWAGASARARRNANHQTYRGGFGGHDFFEDLFNKGGIKTKGADVSYTLEVDFVGAALGTRKRLVLSDGRGMEVTVPPGSRDGDTLRLRGQGLSGLGGGANGDALVTLKVLEHPHFVRKDQDIHLEVPVTLKEAVLGATIEVPTIDGKVAVRVPRGTNNGTSLRLRGKGLPDRQTGARGDQYVKLRLELPDRPDLALNDFVAGWHPADYDPRRKAGLE